MSNTYNLAIKSFTQLEKLKEAYELLKTLHSEINIEEAGYVLSYEKGNIRVHGVGVFSPTQFEEILRTKNSSNLLN